MRFGLTDLLIAMGLMCGGIGGFGIAHAAFGVEGKLGLLAGLVAYVAIAPVIYKRFHLRPLLLPRCPHCRKRPDSYTILERQWPREVVICGMCQGACELQYVDDSTNSHAHASLPRLILAWPQFIGIWRVVQQEPKEFK